MSTILDDEALQEKWVKALRSGEYTKTTGTLRNLGGFWYTKTTGTLRNLGGFCCLGILCEIQREDLGAEWRGSNFFLGDVVVEGSSVLVPNGPLQIQAQWLSELNDTGKTFEEIANIIEKGVE